jgi:hypothetical protein
MSSVDVIVIFGDVVGVASGITCVVLAVARGVGVHTTKMQLL